MELPLWSFTLSPASFFVRSCTIARYAASPLQGNLLGIEQNPIKANL